MFALLPHQLPPLDALSEARADGRATALVVMASGLGKTVVLAHEARRLLAESPDARILFLCHQNVILDQAHATFEAVIRPELPAMTYGDFHGGAAKAFHEVSILFASMQSMAHWKDAFRHDEFNYVFIDESHHSQAPTYRPVIEHFTPRFTVAVTATPDRADLKDIRALYGDEIFSLPLEDALAQGLLTPVEYRLVTDEIIETGQLPNPVGMTIKQLNRLLFVPKRDEEIAGIIAKRSADMPNARTVIFCPSIKYAEHLHQFIPGSLPYHSGVPAWQQEVRLNRFRSGRIRTLLTVDKFNEGIDIPEANVIVFLRSTASRTVFFQQLGRGLRKLPGKERVLVLDFVANCERLEIIQELWRKVIQSQDSSAELSPNVTTLFVKRDNITFDERILDVFDIINRVRIGFTKASLIHEIRQFVTRCERLPVLRDTIANNELASYSVYQRVFGSMNNAIVAAGYEPVNFDRSPEANKSAKAVRYTDEELIDALKSTALSLGRIPKQADMKRSNGVAAAITYSKRFGGFNKALKLAGFEIRKKYSRDQLLVKLKQLADQLGRSPTINDIRYANKKGQIASFQTYQKVFGGINAATREANLPSVKNKLRMGGKYSRRELIEQLQTYFANHGRSPGIKEINQSSRDVIASTTAFRREFGTLNAALEAADLPVNQKKPPKASS